MSDRLIWLDLEMTGLNVEKDEILEIACVVTTGNLELVAEGPNLVVHQPLAVIDRMDGWCQEHHGKSGLSKAVLESMVGIKDAELKVLGFVEQYTEVKRCPLAGNSVHMDRFFLMRHMPSLLSHLHYRNVDVSSVKELCRLWYPHQFRMRPAKMEGHRALADIYESIEELQYYRNVIFHRA